MIHSGDFDNYRKVSTGLYRNCDTGYLKSHNIGVLGFKTEAVVKLILIPKLKIYDKVYLFRILYSASSYRLILVFKLLYYIQKEYMEI